MVPERRAAARALTAPVEPAAAASAPQGARVIAVCLFEELIHGAARGFDPLQTGEDTILVLRRATGVRAYRNRCPHQGARLEYRKDRFLSADGERVICHAHGAQFDADTGACVHGACLGQSLEPLPARIEQGWVWVTLPARLRHPPARIAP